MTPEDWHALNVERRRADDYHSRIALARSILSHRFGTTHPDVADVLRALDGESIADIARPPAKGM